MTNPFDFRTDPELNRIFDNLRSLQTRVSKKFEEAEKLAGIGGNPQFLALKNVELIFPDYRNLLEKMRFKQDYLSIITKLIEDFEIKSLAELDETENCNKSLLENNEKLITQIKELMRRIGIEPTYTTYELPSPRSRIKKLITNTAGYLKDLERIKPRSNVEPMRSKLRVYMADFRYWLKSEREKELKEKIAQDEAVIKKYILDNPEFVSMLLMAGVNVLEELKIALPGKKAEIIYYSKAKAISNLQSQPEVDHLLIDSIISVN